MATAGAARSAPARPVVTTAMAAVAVALLVFLPAGRFDWWAAWIWLGTMFLGLVVVRHFVVKAQPDLPGRRRRVGAGTPGWDRLILAVFQLAVASTLVLAALDAGRFGWSSLPVSSRVLGVLLSLGGLGLFGASAVHNPFFESTVRIQSDLEHGVASSGPYRVVRHPGYVGLLLVVLGIPLVLGSAWALLPVGVAWMSLILRTAMEDEYLRERLPGYAEYGRETRYRLIPGLW